MKGPLILLLLLSTVMVRSQDIRRVSRSRIDFLSIAPMENIAATNTAATGIFDVEQRTFAIQVPVQAFVGFNSPLQREHFNENYLESNRFPYMVFQGRLIESTDLSKPGTYRVRAKGDLTVHGVLRERIIECVLVVTKDGIRVTSSFTVKLADHAIRIPRVVHQKIAEDVQVKLDMLIGPKSARP